MRLKETKSNIVRGEAMRSLILCTLLFAAFGTAHAFTENPPSTVDDLDIQRYMGQWHEIAVIPNQFQEQCYTETSPYYELLENGLVKVVNSCVDEDGEVQDITGRARIDPDYDSPGKLEVTFLKIFDWVWLASGYYWVMDISPDYEYALLGHPDRDFGWIIARSQTLPKDTLNYLRNRLIEEGYDPCRLIMSRNSEQPFETRPNLCEYLDNE
jgi:apolipoprotein D and lipocalin family protein